MVVITEQKTFYFDFDWPKNINKNLKHEIEFIIKSNKSVAENKIKNEIEHYCPNISMKMIFMNTENNKTNEPHKFVLNLSQRLKLRSSNKHVTIKNQYINNKLKVIPPTWNDEFELPDGSY